jgi:WD40 repeat protein
VPTRLRTTFRLDLLGPEGGAGGHAGAGAGGRGRVQRRGGAQAGRRPAAQIKVQRPDGTIEMRTGPHVEPVQLQVVCLDLWARRRGRDDGSTSRASARSGTSTTRSRRTTAQVLQIARGWQVPERVLRAWVARHLITEQGLRDAGAADGGGTQGLSNRALQDLVDTHLLRAEARRGALWLELAHDRLVAPLRTSNGAWAVQHLGMFERQAELWDLQGRPDALLLVDAAALAAVHGGERTAVEEAFLASSRVAVRRRARVRRVTWFMRGFAGLALVGLVVAVVFFLRARAQETLATGRMLAAESQLLPRTEYERVALLTVAAGRLAPDEAQGLLLGLHHRWPRFRGMISGGPAVASPTSDELLVMGHAALGGGRMVDLRTRTTRLQVYAGALDEAVLAADGTRAALVGVDVRVVELTPGTPAVWSGRELRRVALDPRGERLAAVDAEGHIVVVDLGEGSPVGRSREAIADGVLALHLDELAVTLVDGDGTLSRFDTAAWDRVDLAQLGAPPDRQAVRAAFSRDGRRVAVGGQANTGSMATTGAVVDVYDTTGTRQLVLRPGADVQALAWDLRGERVAVAFCGGGCAMATVEVWSAAGEQLVTLSFTDIVPDRLGFDRSGERLLVGTDMATLLFDTRIERELPGAPAAAAVSPDGLRIAVADVAGGVRLLAAEDLAELDSLPAPPEVRGLRYAADGQRLLATTRGGVSVIDVAGRTFSTTPATSPIGEVAGRGGELVVAGWDGRSIVVWNGVTGAVVRSLAFAGERAPTMALSPDGSLLATAQCGDPACSRSRVHLWRPGSSDVPEVTPLEVAGMVMALEFAPDGAALLGAAWGLLARWNVPTGGLVVRGIEETVVGDLVISGDGSMLAVVGSQMGHCLTGWCPTGSVSLFAGDDLRAIGPTMRTIGASVPVVTLGRAGEFALVLQSDAEGRPDGELWRLDVASLTDAACALAGRDLSAEEWSHYLGGRSRFTLCAAKGERRSEYDELPQLGKGLPVGDKADGELPVVRDATKAD